MYNARLTSAVCVAVDQNEYSKKYCVGERAWYKYRKMKNYISF